MRKAVEVETNEVGIEEGAEVKANGFPPLASLPSVCPCCRASPPAEESKTGHIPRAEASIVKLGQQQ